MGEVELEKKRERLTWLIIGIIVFLLSLLVRDIYTVGVMFGSLVAGMANESPLPGLLIMTISWILFWGILSFGIGLIIGFILRYPFKFRFALRCSSVTVILELFAVLEFFLFSDLGPFSYEVGYFLAAQFADYPVGTFN